MITQTPSSATEILFSIYGRNPPVQCLGRLKAEHCLANGKKQRVFDDAILISKLNHEADQDGSDITVTPGFNASLVNWLYDASKVNPLPPHYYCRKCKKVEFVPANDGWDLPLKECCGQPMARDGHRIPVEVLGTRLESCSRELIIHLAISFADKAIETIRTFFRYVSIIIPFEDDCSRPGDRRFVIFPKGKQIPELDEAGIWHTTSQDIYNLGLQVITLVPNKRKEQIRQYQTRTGLKPSIDDLLTIPVISATQAKLTVEIQEEGGSPLKADDPSFSSLLKTLGYLASAHTESNPMLMDANAHYTDLFTCREEVWDMVNNALKPEYEISNSFAKMIASKTRRGMFTDNRMKPDTEQLLRAIGIEVHWIEQMKQTGYLPTKADLIPRLLDYMRVVWYELREVTGLGTTS